MTSAVLEEKPHKGVVHMGLNDGASGKRADGFLFCKGKLARSLALGSVLCGSAVFAEQVVEPDWIPIEPQIQSPTVSAATASPTEDVFDSWSYTLLYAALESFTSRVMSGIVLIVK